MKCKARTRAMMEPQRSSEAPSGPNGATQSPLSSSLPAINTSTASDSISVASVTYLQDGVLTLRFVDDDSIHRALQIGRSVVGFDLHSFLHEPLSQAQVEAVFILKQYPDKQIDRWIAKARAAR